MSITRSPAALNGVQQAAAEAAARAEAAAEAAAQAAAQAARAAEQQAAADAEHDERMRLIAQRSDASDAFAELSAAAASFGEVQVLEVAPPAVETVGEEEEPAAEADEPPLGYAPHDTDMASLFRELSSLGKEDEPPPPPVRAAGPPRPPASAPAKRKKGLFGR